MARKTRQFNISINDLVPILYDEASRRETGSSMKARIIPLLFASIILYGCGGSTCSTGSYEYSHTLIEAEMVRVNSKPDGKSQDYFLFQIGRTIYGDYPDRYTPALSECIFKRTEEQTFLYCMLSLTVTTSATVSSSSSSSSAKTTISKAVYVYNSNVEYYCSFLNE